MERREKACLGIDLGKESAKSGRRSRRRRIWPECSDRQDEWGERLRVESGEASLGIVSLRHLGCIL